MVKLRLLRAGTTKRPFYRIVATNSRSPRGGKFLEIVGTYDPRNLQVKKDSENRKEKGIVNLKWDRIEYWLSKGAEPTDTLRTILLREEPAKKSAA